MIINLKQTEIEQALRAYVVAQGISLHGKDLTISFTAGRRESGISAEISIDEVNIPGFTDDVQVDEAAPTAKATVLSLAPAVVTEAPAVESEEVTKTEEATVDTTEPATEAKPTVSLFG